MFYLFYLLAKTNFFLRAQNSYSSVISGVNCIYSWARPHCQVNTYSHSQQNISSYRPAFHAGNNNHNYGQTHSHLTI